MRAQQIVLSRVEAVLKGFDITFARYEVLMLLLFSRQGRLPMRVIGQRLQVHPRALRTRLTALRLRSSWCANPTPVTVARR